MKQNRHYREEYQIMSDIAESIMRGHRKRTAVMYSCRLSYSQLDFYVKLMIVRGLIEEYKDDIGATLYRVNPLGLEFHTIVTRAKEIVGQ